MSKLLYKVIATISFTLDLIVCSFMYSEENDIVSILEHPVRMQFQIANLSMGHPFSQFQNPLQSRG